MPSCIRYNVAMHIDIVPNRGSRPAYLLRESYREGKRVRKRTLANLSALSETQIEGIRAILRGDAVRPVGELFEAVASRPCGHVQAVHVAMQKLGMARLLAGRPSRERDLALAMIAARVERRQSDNVRSLRHLSQRRSKECAE